MLQLIRPARTFATSVACIIALAFPVIATAGTLADLAASMEPGTFAELTAMNGWDGGGILVPDEFGCTSGDYITQYAQKAAWDPVEDRVLFVGQTHGQCYGGRFVLYSERSNAWTKGPWPTGVCQSGSSSSPCFSHAYDHNTVNSATGEMYFRQAFTRKFFRFKNGSWSPIPAPAAQSSQCCGALEYFSDMGRLIFIDGDWGLWSFDPISDSWAQLANTGTANATTGLPNLPMISYNNFALYNPFEKTLLFGGGSYLYKMSSAGEFTTLKAPPVKLGVTSAVISIDPASGKFIVLSGSSMYQYDVSTDTWIKLPIAIPTTLTALDGVGDGLVQAPVTEHGVIMYIKYNFSNSKVYLYKHSPFTAVAPRPPSSITVK